MAAIVRPILAASPHRAVAVAIVDGPRDEILGFGPRSESDARPPDADTTFEIGSVSKVLVGLLLADAISRGEVALEDPVGRHLPEGFVVPSLEGHEITLAHLATHTSGLPPSPDNWIPLDPTTHRIRYTPEHFRTFLATFTLPRAPGALYEYGNTGTGLLALALATRAGLDYHELLSRRLLTPLGMRRTMYVDRARVDENALDGYGDDDEKMPWRVDASPIGPCCAVRSSLADLVRFMRAGLGETSPLERTFAVVAEPRVPIDATRDDWVSLGGWVVSPRESLLWKDGQVSGYRCVMALLPRSHRALFVVVNSQEVAIEPLASELLGALFAPDATERADSSQHASFVVRELPATATRTDATFGDSIRFEGYEAPAEARRGERVRVTFYFRCVKAIDRDWKVFVHGDAAVAAPTAPRIAGDHFPGGGRDSTRVWRAGELIRDEFEIAIPATYSADAFTIRTGWYRRFGGRMPARSSSVEVTNDKVPGPVIRVTN